MRPGGVAGYGEGLPRAKQFGHARQAGADVFHGVVAVGLFQPRLTPFTHWRRWLRGFIIGRGQFTFGKLQAFIIAQIVIIFFEISAKSKFTGYIFGHANISKSWVFERNPIVSVPASKEAPANTFTDTA
jgi:hypothetical protein